MNNHPQKKSSHKNQSTSANFVYKLLFDEAFILENQVFYIKMKGTLLEKSWNELYLQMNREDYSFAWVQRNKLYV